ncbi:MAG: cytochrome C [Flavobacteriaceae bacterium]|nr:MAG: cytochrome C [Flavobacteriaceae bacterium]
MKLKITLLAILSLLIYSCATKSSVPTEVVKKEEPKVMAFATILDTELTEGKMLYENNCNKCHELFEPKRFTASQWSPIVYRMQKEAGITDVDREKIYKYLTANSQ